MNLMKISIEDNFLYLWFLSEFLVDAIKVAIKENLCKLKTEFEML